MDKKGEIDKLSKIGVDVVKFKTHLAYYESTKEENFRKGFKNFNLSSNLILRWDFDSLKINLMF